MTDDVVQTLGDEVKMVRGLWYCDGIAYRRWMPAICDRTMWIGHDTGEAIASVDAVLEMSSLDDLHKPLEVTE